MFKKLKQRIEEGDQPPQTTSNVLASTPKKNTKPPSVRSYINSNTNLKRENKWEKRRRSNASLYSSRESLLSLDSAATATVSRNSCGESFCSAETPIESQLIIGTVRLFYYPNVQACLQCLKNSMIKYVEGQKKQTTLEWGGHTPTNALQPKILSSLSRVIQLE